MCYVARSAAKYSRRQYSERRFSAIQRERQALQAEAMAAKAADPRREVAAMRSQGYAVSTIAEALGVTRQTIYRDIKRGV